MEFDQCSDQVQISGNSLTGPAFEGTNGLELYARNLLVASNTISGYPLEGIALSSVFNATASGNIVTNNGWADGLTYPTYRGGIVVATAPLLGDRCGETRDANVVYILGNTSIGQPYGIHFASLWEGSKNQIDSVTIANNSLVPNDRAQVAEDVFIKRINYSGPTVTNTGLAHQVPRVETVRAISPLTTRCATPGNTLQTFNFPASDPLGANNISWIQAAFSISGADSDGTGGPDPGAQGCHLLYFPSANVLYLDGPNGGNSWNGSTVVGPGGTSVTNGFCTVHAGSAASQVTSDAFTVNLQLQIEFPFSVTSSAKKHIYTISGNSAGTFSNQGTWAYWGWWSTP